MVVIQRGAATRLVRYDDHDDDEFDDDEDEDDDDNGQ